MRIGIDPDPPRHCYIAKRAHPSWSPDGQFIAYLRGGEDPDDPEDIGGLFIYDLINQTERLVILGATGKSSQAWNPDGKWLVFGVGAQIWKVNVNGGSPIKLTEDNGGAYFDPAWSPNGEWIVYSDGSARDSSGTWLMNNDGTNKKWVAPQKGGLPIWKNNNEIITIKSLEPADIDYRFLVWNPFINNEPDTLRAKTDAINMPHSFNQTRREIIFQSVHRYEGDRDIWKINADGSGLRRLTTNGGAYPAWSPDGSTIAYVNIDYFEGGGFIWLMDADGSNRRPMVED